MKKNNTIFAIGAFDRFNYGDLLFPIISKNFAAKHYPHLNFDSYALIHSDYSRFGALKTKPISELYKNGGVSDGDVIYFCGGGILGSDWQSMYANLLGDHGNKLLYYASRLLGYDLTSKLIRLYFGAKSEFPWIASPEDFTANVKVIYNAAGGSELGALPEKLKALALKKLATAAHLSVRDAETKRICASIENSTPVHLMPDSAVLMSEQYPLSHLETVVNADLRNLVSQGRYVCFHANYGYVKENMNVIASQLEKIYQDYGLRALLLPIGRYVGLDDQKGLRELKEHVKTPCEVISEHANIWEIMYSIASSSLFIGTSLHGNVTSQSFAVPHIGLSDRKSKLDFYLEAWDIPEQKTCPDITKINESVKAVMAVPESARLQKRDELIRLATENLHNIMKIASS